jgi:hypothetical protein
MGVQRGTPPNWGRSARATTNTAQNTQLVRVDLATPSDLALYLGGWVNDRHTAGQPGRYRVVWGSGGTSETDDVTTPVVGQVLHLVAAEVRVDAIFEGNLAAAVTARASLGIGRPTPSQFTYIAAGSTVSLQTVTSGTPRTVQVPPWCTRVRLEVFDLVGVAADATVRENDLTGGAIFTRPVSNYADFQNLDAGTWTLRLQAVIGTTYSALVVFERFT